MAKRKTTELTTITASALADGDWFPVVDVSDTTDSSTGTNKKIAKSELAEAAGLTAHLADTSDAHDASAISFSATGTISSTDVQTAVAEVSGDVTAHLADTSDAHDASAISVLDSAGNFSGDDVEEVLAELPGRYAPTPICPSPATLTVTSLGDGSALNPVPLCIMANGYIVGGWNQVLYYSTDEGRSWTEAEILSTSGRVLCVRELADGEIIATTDYSADNYKGHIYKSSGWATDPVTATFTKVHETANTRGHFIDRSVAVWGSYVAAGEYGVQGYAQKAYLSSDDGDTWVEIFDMADYPTECPDLPNGHVHGLNFDTVDERIYLATGDQQNKGMWYAAVATPTVWTRIYQEQPTTVIAAKAGILWGTDNSPHGILRTRRANLTAVEMAWTAPEGVVGATAYTRGRTGDPILFAFGPLNEGDQGYIVGTADGGESFHQLYAHPATSAILRAYGPTDEDMVLGVLTDDGTSVWNPYYAKAPTWSLGEIDEHTTVRRRWLPATQAYVVAGSAALGVASSRVPVYLMDGASNETISWYYEVPTHWTTWAADVLWLNTTTSSGAIVLAVTHNEIHPNGGSITSGPEVVQSYLTCTARASTTLLKSDTVIASATNRFGMGHLRIQRRPGESGDTLANDIGVVGVVLRRLS